MAVPHQAISVNGLVRNRHWDGSVYLKGVKMDQLFLSTVTDGRGHVLGVLDPLEGFRPAVAPRRQSLGEDDVLAQALWLERRGDSDGGLTLIENFLDGRLPH